MNQPDFCPHVTVATIVQRDNRFLLVEENSEGRVVINQPAGHLEAGESLQQAALRETLEETGWQVRLTGVLGLQLYLAPANGCTYYRTSFIAEALAPVPDATLDQDIIRPLWLDYDEILACQEQHRSPMVLECVRQYLQGKHYPLDIVGDYR